MYYIFNKSQDNNIIFLKELLFSNIIEDKKELINFNLSYINFEKIILKKIWKLKNEDKELCKNDKNNYKIKNIFKNLKNLEIRENQFKMTELVMNTLINKNKVVIEAPTWLWKSFAYLIPSIIYSIKNNQRVFISTKTKNLQDQLYFKDILYLKENIWIDFKYTKLKWKKNYISVNLFFKEFWIDNITYTKISFLSKILLWFYETKYWELDELNFYWKEYNYLKFINADNFFILNEKNDYKNYEYLNKARKKLDISDIIIINHSLLFSDINSDLWVLWKINNLIIDEWHNIEDSITDSLKKSYNIKLLKDNFEIIEKILNKINSKKIKYLGLKDNIISILDLLDDYSIDYFNINVWNNAWNKSILIKNDFYKQNNFTPLLKKIELDFIDVIDFLSIEKEYNFSKEIWILQTILEILKIIFANNSNNKYIKILSIIWNNEIKYEYTLLNPWEYLNNKLWKKLDSCILTSATLKIWWNFDYFKKILFLEEFKFNSFDSDFDYKKQSTLFIPSDLSNIKYKSNDTIDFLWNFFSIVRWKILMLLTSYTSIKDIYIWLNIKMKQQWINLYAQWLSWSKSKLLNDFIENSDNSILLWTDSFWEWIDIPWEDLKYLIIYKFPFIVPSDPIFQSRKIFFNDPFLEYSIPKAIIKLKQWFWRLIRKKTDKWIVILLDNRILYTKWWNKFYESFPSNINKKVWKNIDFLRIIEKKYKNI